MMLQDGMLLYHGSYTKVEKIDLSLCADGKDKNRKRYNIFDAGNVGSLFGKAPHFI